MGRSVGAQLVACLSQATAGRRLDLGCVAAHGIFSCDAEGVPTLTPHKMAATKFLFELIARLQTCATAPMQKALVAAITEDLEKTKLKDALHKTMSFSKNANRYFQDNKPWELVKKDKARADIVMGILSCQIYDLSILIEPYLPVTSAEIKKQMNLQDSRWADIGTPLTAGHQIGEPKTLFRKISLRR